MLPLFPDAENGAGGVIAAARKCRSIKIMSTIGDEARLGKRAAAATLEGMKHCFGQVWSNLEHGTSSVRTAVACCAVQITLLIHEEIAPGKSAVCAGKGIKYCLNSIRRNLKDGTTTVGTLTAAAAIDGRAVQISGFVYDQAT